MVLIILIVMAYFVIRDIYNFIFPIHHWGKVIRQMVRGEESFKEVDNLNRLLFASSCSCLALALANIGLFELTRGALR